VSAARCPTCKKPATKAGNKVYPFCCERCQLVDLGAWLDEKYRIPEDTDAKPAPPGEDPET
jgi:endogenous inhibitor of DNA gyrase (YacG/DUF329 family)